MHPIRTIHVFIASPSDLAVERRAFKEVIEELNKGFADSAGVQFVGLGWEDTLAMTGRRSQEVINQDIDRCDVFILAMHRRWGQEAPDAKPYSSYTEEEFHRAFNRWKKDPPNDQERAPEVFVFFKHIDPGQMADPGPQLLKVLAFRKSLEESRQVLYHLFSDEAGFKKEVDRHLRAFAKGELPKADAPRDTVLLPLKFIEVVEKAKAAAEQAVKDAGQEHQKAELANARAEQLALALAEHAIKAANAGRLEEARQLFAKAQLGTTNLGVLYLASEFYKRTGDQAAAEELRERGLAIVSQSSVEHLVALIEDSEEAGILEPQQAELAQNVFRFSNLKVRDCMVPREKMGTLELSLPPEQILEKVRAGAHTRLPAYDGELDNIVGIVNSKDLLNLFTLRGVVVIEDAMYPALFLKPDDSVADALGLFRKAHRHMALVRDDVGKIHGLITLEDVLEEIIGDIEDEFDRPSLNVSRTGVRAKKRLAPPRA
jgi:CBS domain-containing protein